jgi:DNA-directed RNA polymerase subunit omega
MDVKDFLTNEKVAKKFKNTFDLVNYAIRLAENMIKSGRDSRVRTDSQNRAMQILGEIINDKDEFDEILDQPILEDENYQNGHKNGAVFEKPVERKKNRKILAN